MFSARIGRQILASFCLRLCSWCNDYLFESCFDVVPPHNVRPLTQSSFLELNALVFTPLWSEHYANKKLIYRLLNWLTGALIDLLFDWQVASHRRECVRSGGDAGVRLQRRTVIPAQPHLPRHPAGQRGHHPSWQEPPLSGRLRGASLKLYCVVRGTGSCRSFFLVWWDVQYT